MTVIQRAAAAAQLLRVLLVSCLALVGLTTVTQHAEAVGSYDNATIADIALAEVGQWGGQCKAFANTVVGQASGSTQWPAPGYHSGFQGAGGVEVSSSNATKGDIIQVGDSDNDWPLHTAIIVSNNGDGNFTVVDSNWGHDEMVSQHSFNPYVWGAGSVIKIWRMGTIGSAGNGTTDVGVWSGGHFHLRAASGTTTTLQYGNSTDTPITGDWDGNGTTDVGVWRTGYFYLRSASGTTTTLQYGNSTDTPITGDWDGNGTTDVGVWRTGYFYLRSASGTTTTLQYGNSTDTPITGDWGSE